MKYLVAATIGAIAGFLIIGFIFWDANPGNYTVMGRLIAVCMAAICGGVGVGLCREHEQQRGRVDG
ncbi:hypothetical protein [Marinobacter sp. OP 3.4]|uniref:hypothetical protein n=1 Tax=Marinobacter sp. OP 3.4 TaxID=3076501 RepID=UPI002E1F3567